MKGCDKASVSQYGGISEIGAYCEQAVCHIFGDLVHPVLLLLFSVLSTLCVAE